MRETEIREVVFKVLRQIAPETDPSSLAPEANLREALDIDSFDFLRFVTGLHEALGVDIPESDYSQITSLSGVLGYLAARRT